MTLEPGAVWRAKQKGATLVLVGLAMVALLGVMSLAVDLGMLYVARSQAQRAADAAALAGAKVFKDTNCAETGGCITVAAVTTAATLQAQTVGAQNTILGQPANILATDISYTDPSTNGTEPQITVTVGRTAARGNAIPTIFSRVFGVNTADVSAKATAEAYTPGAGGNTIGVSKVVPFLVPNCDPNHPVPASSPAANTDCDAQSGPGSGATVPCPTGVTGTCYPSYFLWPVGSSPPPPAVVGQIVNSGDYPTGVIGEFWQLHWGTTGPSDGAAPSQWYLIAFGGSESGAQLRQYIAEGAPTPIACGAQLQTMNGKKVGPTVQGVEALINASGESPAQGVYPATGQPFQDGCASLSAGCAQGQDILDLTPGSQFLQIMGGSNNPNPNLVGQVYPGPSPSTVAAPVYSGNALTPGGSTVTVVGLLQVFIAGVEHQGSDVPVDAVITGVEGCNSTTPPPTVEVSPGTVPIRLIQGPG